MMGRCVPGVSIVRGCKTTMMGKVHAEDSGGVTIVVRQCRGELMVVSWQWWCSGGHGMATIISRLVCYN